MPFEVSSPLAELLDGNIRAYVTEVGGVAPTTLIRTDQNALVHVEWSLDGALTEFICGSWCVSVHMESIGPGPEIRLPEPALTLDLAPAPGRNDYQAVVTIPAHSIEPQGCAAPYKLAVVVSYRSPAGRATSMAGFVELPILTFYTA